MALSDTKQIKALDERRELLMSVQALLTLDALRIVAALVDGPRPRHELAALIKQPADSGRGALARLNLLDIVITDQFGDDFVCTLNQQRLYELNGMLQRLSKDLLAEKTPTPADALELAEEDRRILRSCFRGDQLIELPTMSNQRRLQLVLGWLASLFDPTQSYHEREVNTIIKRHHEDSASLRRYLVEYGYLTRDHDIYRRVR
ncbi:DUF2087 domain-containing protein [Candidatus Gracilibacteria bacterium]|nr:DUF2087 domain-containing protein [Candidatus Gracilibacteria bacterium]